jgi:hypothetical protein
MLHYVVCNNKSGHSYKNRKTVRKQFHSGDSGPTAKRDRTASLGAGMFHRISGTVIQSVE